MEIELSPREWAVAVLVPTGKTNQEIADELGVDIKTIKFHMTRIFKRTSCRNRVELAFKISKFLGSKNESRD